MSTDTVYQMVTERVVAMLEQGTVPWRQPWTASTSGPRNIEGRAYRGINVFLLLAESMANGYSSPYWMTFKQAKERGGSVRKGERSTVVVFWKRLQVKDTDADGNEVRKTIPMLRYYRVFNLEQTEGVKLPKSVQAEQDREPQVFDAHEAAETVMANYPNPPKVREAGTAAWYQPATDLVNLPPRETFDSPDAFYTTAFHELGHSTAHASRLDRKTGDVFGSHDYGREELVAEMTAAFLSAETGIESQQVNSAAYLANWVQAIQEDVRAVVVAAGAAQRAADYILGRHVEQQAAA